MLRATNGTRPRGPQLEFNRLTRRIAVLQHRIVKERERLEGLLRKYLVTVRPVELDLAPRQLALAQALSAAAARWPVRGPQLESVRLLILKLVGDVLDVEGENPEAVSLRNDWSSRGRTDDPAKNAAIKKKLVEQFRAEFGYDAKVADDGDDSAQGFERFRARLGAALREADEEQVRRSAEARMNKRDLRKRQRLAEQENVRLRSIRAIYLALAKVLHPDASALAGERARRESDMKRAVEAYKKQDLVTLLELEQCWGTREGEDIARLGDDVLEVYIATLRQRVKALDRELDMQMYDRRFSEVLPVVELSSRHAVAGIERRAEQRRDDLRRTDELLAELAGCKGKRQLARLVTDFLDYEERRMDLELERAFEEDF